MLYFPLLGEQSSRQASIAGGTLGRDQRCAPREDGASIMAVPKRRHSNARTNSRRANHDKKEPRHLTYCAQCSSAVPPHTVCPKCGHYMGRKVVDIES